MIPTQFDRFRTDPDNWQLGFIYFAKGDLRLAVPKRVGGLGLTLNFARPLAIILVVTLAAFESILGVKLEALGLSLKVILVLGILCLVSRCPNSLKRENFRSFL